MSLYNMLFGVNPFSSTLLTMLDLNQSSIPRYRNCFLNEAGEIVVHTRTGGGNRPDYELENNKLTLVPGYLGDADDDFDSTYANFRYAVPEEYKELVEAIKGLGAVGDPRKRWQEVLDGMRQGDTSKPGVKRAIEVGEQIMDKINKTLKEGI